MNIAYKKLEKSKGKLEVKIKNNELLKLFQQGSFKALIPNFHENLQQLMMINTAGGITSGDEFDSRIDLDNSNICVSTQAAEKIYSGFGDPAKVDININISNKGNLFWLPKELILFNNCNLKRKFNINLSKDSNLFLCESIVFGRTSMNEKLKSGFFSDLWKIYYDKKLIHTEALNTSSFNGELLKSQSILNSNCAIATIILVGKNFFGIGHELSKIMTKDNYTTTEYSTWDKKLIIRCISKDSYNLKFAINKILSYFFKDSQIPKIWHIYNETNTSRKR